MYLFNKTSYLNEEVNCTEPSPSVSIPWLVFLSSIVPPLQIIIQFLFPLGYLCIYLDSEKQDDTTLSITTFSIMTLSMKGLFAAFCIKHYAIMMNIFMLSVSYYLLLC